jgi:hypothetical protein
MEPDDLSAALDAQRAILTWLLPEILSRFGNPPLETLKIAKEGVLKIALRMPAPLQIRSDPEAYRTTVTALADAMLEDLRPILADMQARGAGR